MSIHRRCRRRRRRRRCEIGPYRIPLSLLLSLPFLSQQLLSSDPQILFEQYRVPAVCFPDSEEDVAHEGDKASSDADGGVEDHLGLEPFWDVGFAGFADDEVVVEKCVGDGADDGDEGDEE